MGRTAQKPLTALKIKSKLPIGLHCDAGCSGLYLQVSAFETKAWVYRFMMGKKKNKKGKLVGRARKMGLGPVSLKDGDGKITLADARQMAADARKLIVQGIDPIEERAARKAGQAAETAKAMTFKECAGSYIEAHKAGWKNAKHADQWEATLTTYAYPVIGHLPVQAIDTAHVMKVLEPIWKTKTETASRVRGRIEKVLDRAKALKLRAGENPAQWKGNLDQLLPIKSQVAPVENHPALAYSQMPTFMTKLRARESVSARALEFLILTAARTGDVIGATWPEINKAERVWTVPAARMKGRKGANRRDHVVPLSDRALAALEALPQEGDFVFPGGKEGAGLSNAAMSELLKGMGYAPDVATVHGFRSAFKDWAAEMTAYPNELSEMAMAHTVSNKVEAAYRRGDMREKRQRLMDDWSAYCAGKAVGGDNVVAIGGKR